MEEKREKWNEGRRKQSWDLMTEVKPRFFFPKLKGFFFSVPPDDGKSSITHYTACSGYKSNEFSPLKKNIFEGFFLKTIRGTHILDKHMVM